MPFYGVDHKLLEYWAWTIGSYARSRVGGFDTVQAFADAFGLDVFALSRLEDGNPRDRDVLVATVHALEVDAIEIFHGPDPQSSAYSYYPSGVEARRSDDDLPDFLVAGTHGSSQGSNDGDFEAGAESDPRENESNFFDRDPEAVMDEIKVVMEKISSLRYEETGGGTMSAPDRLFHLAQYGLAIMGVGRRSPAEKAWLGKQAFPDDDF